VVCGTPPVSWWGVCVVLVVVVVGGGGELTPVVVVPAPGVVVGQQGGALPGVQQEVHLVLLPPDERLAEHLACLLQVEVARAQEPQHVLVLGDLSMFNVQYTNPQKHIPCL